MTTRFLARLNGAFFVTAIAALAQTPAAPRFEVASIRMAADLMSQVTSGKPPRIGTRIDGTRVDIGSQSLFDLICTAYKVKPYQVSGPGWMTSNRFDVTATIPDGVSKDQVPEMLQTLLAERFKLAIHRESRERAAYALLVGKSGLQLKASLPDSDAPAPADSTVVDTGNGPMSVKADSKGGAFVSGGPNGNMRVSPAPDGIRYEFSRMSMPSLAETLSQVANLPVLDMTDVKGNYQVALDVPMRGLMSMAGGAVGADAGNAPADAASDPSGGGAIFENVQKLGLKLEKRKLPVEILVVDHLEKTPAEN